MCQRESLEGSILCALYCPQTLASKFSAMGLQATVIPNGYTMSSLPAPSSLAAREVIGYVGTIGRWFDWPLVLEMACALPSLRIQLIGPEFVPRPVLPSNVEMIPECSQAEAVDHIRKFRVGLIPFLRMPLTESVDPIKYYEYRALGVPVWKAMVQAPARGYCTNKAVRTALPVPENRVSDTFLTLL